MSIIFSSVLALSGNVTIAQSYIASIQTRLAGVGALLAFSRQEFVRMRIIQDVIQRYRIWMHAAE